MKYKAGDIIQFNYGTARTRITRTILLLKRINEKQWRAELMNDSNGYYENDGVFHVFEDDKDTKLLWRKN